MSAPGRNRGLAQLLAEDFETSHLALPGELCSAGCCTNLKLDYKITVLSQRRWVIRFLLNERCVPNDNNKFSGSQVTCIHLFSLCKRIYIYIIRLKTKEHWQISQCWPLIILLYIFLIKMHLKFVWYIATICVSVSLSAHSCSLPKLNILTWAIWSSSSCFNFPPPSILDTFSFHSLDRVQPIYQLRLRRSSADPHCWRRISEYAKVNTSVK